jgi:hypothetical protein
LKYVRELNLVTGLRRFARNLERMSLAILLSLLLSAAPGVLHQGKEKSAKKQPRERHDASGSVVLNGEMTRVVWSDGDSFRIKSGPQVNRTTRLVGYNCLEAYGPVHRWGTWTPSEL